MGIEEDSSVSEERQRLVAFSSDGTAVLGRLFDTAAVQHQRKRVCAKGQSQEREKKKHLERKRVGATVQKEQNKKKKRKTKKEG